jgi:hypothetical protein
MDVASWPAWDTELRAALAESPLMLGVCGTLTPRSGPESHFRVVEFDEGHSYAFETTLPLAALRITRSLAPSGTATTFTHRVRFTGPLGWLFAALYGDGFRLALPRVMQALARRAAVMTAS